MEIDMNLLSNGGVAYFICKLKKFAERRFFELQGVFQANALIFNGLKLFGDDYL